MIDLVECDCVCLFVLSVCTLFGIRVCTHVCVCVCFDYFAQVHKSRNLAAAAE